MVILAVHGGAGGDGPWRGMTDADPQRVACMKALLNDLGARLVAEELTATEAVTLAVEAMEDEALFNAGLGSVMDESGGVSMDASIMRGSDRAAGAVIGLTASRHPIRVARHLLEQGWPVVLAGAPGDAFGAKNGVEQLDGRWFLTDLRRAQWTKWSEQRLRPGATDEEDALLDHDGEEDGWGTVGAVALDAHGNVAAATSTGGMTGKPMGRVGDTPIIGAGTWADENVAVSCTGVGGSVHSNRRGAFGGRSSPYVVPCSGRRPRPRRGGAVRWTRRAHRRERPGRGDHAVPNDADVSRRVPGRERSGGHWTIVS